MMIRSDSLMRAGGNLGATPLPRRRSRRDPMRDFDSLPPPLRHWVTQATLPWSPRSCRLLWTRWRQAGLSVEDTLVRLSQAEARMIAAQRSKAARPPATVPQPTAQKA